MSQLMFFLKGGIMRRKTNGESFDFYQRNYGWHQNDVIRRNIEETPKSLTTDVKDLVIDLLFVTDEKDSVSDEARKELHEYMDARFEQCHSLALHVTEKDRAREPEEKSSFTLLCEKLGLDPGRKEVQVTDRLQVLYSDDYAVPGQPR